MIDVQVEGVKRRMRAPTEEFVKRVVIADGGQAKVELGERWACRVAQDPRR